MTLVWWSGHRYNFVRGSWIHSTAVQGSLLPAQSSLQPFRLLFQLPSNSLYHPRFANTETLPDYFWLEGPPISKHNPQHKIWHKSYLIKKNNNNNNILWGNSSVRFVPSQEPCMPEIQISSGSVNADTLLSKKVKWAKLLLQELREYRQTRNIISVNLNKKQLYIFTIIHYLWLKILQLKNSEIIKRRNYFHAQVSRLSAVSWLKNTITLLLPSVEAFLQLQPKYLLCKH